jgi:uncharacterized Fe-S cluster protein YjdI
MCVSHCEHGGVCILPLGHESTHDSKFCRWLDKEAISKEEADKRLATMPGGKQTLELEDLFFGGKHDD